MMKILLMIIFFSIDILGFNYSVDKTSSKIFLSNDDKCFECQYYKTILYSDSNVLEYTIPSGEVIFRVIFYENNQSGEIQWSIHLGNGDRIKSLSGTFIILRDIFGPINPVLSTMNFDRFYDVPYTRAGDCEYFSLSKVYKDSDDFIIQATNFVVYGLQGKYLQKYVGELQVELNDFRD